MAIERYLMHKKKGTIYPYNPVTAQNPNLVLYDPAKAKIRIEATREMLKDAQAALTPEQQAAHSAKVSDIASDAKELAALNNALDKLHEDPLRDPVDAAEAAKTAEQVEADPKAELVEADDQIKGIKAMTIEKDVAKYIAREFGEKLDVKMFTLAELKDRALNLRAQRVLAGD
jgi:hypothetical protein